MKTAIKCPGCGKKYRIPIAEHGQQKAARCKSCGAVFDISENTIQPQSPLPAKTEVSETRAERLENMINRIAYGIVAVTMCGVLASIVIFPELRGPAVILVGIGALLYVLWSFAIASDLPEGIYVAVGGPIVVVGFLGLVLLMTTSDSHAVLRGVAAASICLALVYVGVRLVTVYVRPEFRHLIGAIAIPVCLTIAGGRFVSREYDERAIHELEQYAASMERTLQPQLAALQEQRMETERQARRAARAAASPAEAPQLERPAPAAQVAAAPARAPQAPPVVTKTLEQLVAERYAALSHPGVWLQYAADDELDKESRRNYEQSLAHARLTPVPGIDAAKKSARIEMDSLNKKHADQRSTLNKKIADTQRNRNASRRNTMTYRQLDSQVKSLNEQLRRLGPQQAQEKNRLGERMKQLEAAEGLHRLVGDIGINIQYGQLKRAVVLHSRAQRESQSASSAHTSGIAHQLRSHEQSLRRAIAEQLVRTDVAEQELVDAGS